MVDREEKELTWRKEFDELGEAGVRHEFFKSAYLSNQRKEGFAYRWLGEKRKEQQREEAGRNQRIGLVALITLLCLVVLAAGALFFGFDEILDKIGSALQFTWWAITGTLGKPPLKSFF